LAGVIRIKPGREKSIFRHHPWVFSGAVAEVFGDPKPGETVAIESAGGEFLARGAYSPTSQIRARIWTWDPDQQIDQGFFHNCLQAAISLREAIPELLSAQAVRLVHAESDRLPGLIVDRYQDWLVMMCLSSGIERWRDPIADLLMQMLPVRGIYERSDIEVRHLEGLEERAGLLRGSDFPGRLVVKERDLSFWVDVIEGHKTGFYLDQRESRMRVQELSVGREVLDCFCYTGGFTLSALAGGASSVTAIDASAGALGLTEENIRLNGYSLDPVRLIEGDVFQQLRRFRDMGQSFDLIVLDPPKFASNAAQVEKAARGYKDINLLALKLLRPGGLLATFSCSGSIDPALFQKIVASAAQDANVDAQIIDSFQQAADHPVALNFPEGLYLKGLLVYRA
jgi:23S rRNA (cytosine1962-C5)-methyltransferase